MTKTNYILLAALLATALGVRLYVSATAPNAGVLADADAKTDVAKETATPRPAVPMAVRIHGEIYTATGQPSTVTARCGVMDGEITSSAAANEYPQEDNQSNFGSGFGYQYGREDGQIEILIKDKWMVFERKK